MKKIFTLSFLVAALFCSTDALAQTALYGRPIGALYCGVTETGSRLGQNQYLVVPSGVDITFPNRSTDASEYYWTYNNIGERADTVYVDDETTTTSTSSTADGLTLSIPSAAEGKFIPMPIVYADNNPFQMNVYKVKVENGVYTNTDGTKSYWLCNHGMYGTTGAKARHYSTARYCLNSETTNSNWLSSYEDNGYTDLTIEGFIEYFRQPLKNYKLKGVNAMIYNPTISSTGLQVQICKATANEETGAMSSYTTNGAYATWTATSDNMTQIKDKYYMMSFTGDEVEIDGPIAIKLSPVNSDDTETTFTLCHSLNPQNLGAADQSAYLYANVTKEDGTTANVRLSAYRPFSFDYDGSGETATCYMRSFEIYLNLEYIDDTTDITGVSVTENTTKQDNVAYNLQGQRVSPNTKGIVIINGKKVINR